MKKTMTLLAAFFLSGTMAMTAQAAEPTPQDLEKLQQEIKELQQILKETQQERSSIEQGLEKTEKEIGQFSKDAQKIKSSIKQTSKSIKRLETEKKSLNEARNQQQDLIKQQIRASYQLGQQPYLKLLLSQENPAQLARVLTYYDYFNQARQQKVQTFTKTITRLDSVTQELIEKKAQLKKSKTTLDHSMLALSNSKKKRKQVLNKLKGQLKDKNTHLQQLYSDRQQLEDLLQQVSERINALGLPNGDHPFAQLKGKLPWPTKGKLSNRFGRRTGQGKLKWNGLVIKTAEGNKVSAIHGGRVVFADRLRGSGLLLILDHGNGYMSLYGQNQSLLKQVGDWVAPGENIALVGNSGGQQTSGLYFEIRHKGKPVDPVLWCTRKHG